MLKFVNKKDFLLSTEIQRESLWCIFVGGVSLARPWPCHQNSFSRPASHETRKQKHDNEQPSAATDSLSHLTHFLPLILEKNYTLQIMLHLGSGSVQKKHRRSYNWVLPNDARLFKQRHTNNFSQIWETLYTNNISDIWETLLFIVFFPLKK